MKNFFLLFFILLGLFVGAQTVDTLPAIDSVIVLNYDSLPSVAFFDGTSNGKSISRIATFFKQTTADGYIFLLFVVYSVLLCIIYLNSINIVSASFKTLFNFQFALQFYRTEKERNTFYYFLYLLFFILSLSFFMQSIINTYTNQQSDYLKVFLFTAAFFLLDFLSSFIYLLFTKSSKSIATVQSSILSFAIVFCINLWPLIAFVLVGNVFVHLSVTIIGIAILSMILILKELRVFQILLNEKVEILSFHFFTYLCTFKFLPIIILVKVFLN